jgi:zinc/manganese transport system ATP-binding protein
MNKADIITGKDLAAGYGDRLVWNDADFAVKKGEFVGVIGPNGAGKSTLFRLILGLAEQKKGTLTVFGEKPKRGDSRIGYVPQRHAIDPDLSIEVLEIVRLVSCGYHFGFDLPKGARAERNAALEALRDVGAEELANRPLGSLSGGELQRVFLAQALAGNPELLLLDEPLANLDMRRESEMVELIKRVVESRGVTALLIAHNINPLLPVLDRVMYVASGRVATGSAEEVLNSDALSKLYGSPIEVLHDSRGRIAIIGAEEGAHHHDHD